MVTVTVLIAKIGTQRLHFGVKFHMWNVFRFFDPPGVVYSALISSRVERRLEVRLH